MPMNLRFWLNQNSAQATLIAVVLLVVALGVMVSQVSDGQGGLNGLKKYVYDLNSGELLVVPFQTAMPMATRTGPYELPDGRMIPAGVDASVFFCGDEQTESNTYLGYLELPAHVMRMKEADGPAVVDEESERYGGFMEPNWVRAVDGEMWFSVHSQEGMAVIREGMGQCESGARPLPATPR